MFTKVHSSLFHSLFYSSSLLNIPINSSYRFFSAISTKSTVELGSQFEQETINVLTSLNIHVSSCGGPNDKGIDLQGEWILDNQRIPVYCQCKRIKVSKPQTMREFVGVLGREYNSLHIHDLHSISKDVLAPIGIFCLSSSITNSLLRESALCPYPLIICQIQDKLIKSLQPNYSLLQYYPDLQFTFDINNTSIPTIVYKNQIIFENKSSLFYVCWDPTNLDIWKDSFFSNNLLKS